MREMKDSGIEWIGEIPKDWERGCIKNILEVLTDYTANGSFADLAKNVHYLDNDGFARLVRLTDLRLDLSNDDGVYVGEKTYNYLAKSSLFGGEILVANVGAYAGLFCEMPPKEGRFTLGPNMFLLRTNKRMIQHYLFYLGQAKFVKEQLAQKAISSAQPKLNKTDLKTVFIAIPSIAEQQQIADYLDTKCSEIDATAEDIQKEISLLEEYKKSVITEAVTKGLNPDAEMKDSGVKWLPKIPKHWKVIPSKELFANSDIRRQTGDEQLTASQKYGIITQKDYTAKENAQIVLATQGLEKWKHVEPNDFIISLRSFQGGLEMSEITGCITWHYVVLKAQKKVYHKYYKWLFKSARYINALQGTCNFIRDGQDLRFSNFALVPLFELPLEEQQQIADYLDSKCSEIDTLIADKKRQLDILADYKKSLIYEYVTGKKEVPVKDF